jgi:hypothetical protein
MSDDRLERIETLLGGLAADIAALRGDITTLRAETRRDIAELRTETRRDIAELRTEMATKEDLAGVAKNVEVSAIGRQLRDLLAMKDDVTVLTAIVQRLDNTMARQISDLLTEVRAEHSRMDRLLNRVRALEDAQPA